MKTKFVILYVLCSTTFLWANAYITEGLERYAQGDYSSSVLSFQKAIDASGGVNEEAQYWLTMALASDKRYSAALTEAKRFLAVYPKSSKHADMQYQKGRLECSTGEYEASISTLYDFIQTYPNNTSVASAYFWIGESLYNTSRLAEARTLFSVVVLDYPNSAKVEAAKYKLALIDRASTQEELLRLLKLSNDETIRLSQELEKLKAQVTQSQNIVQTKIVSNENDTARIAELERALIDERRKTTELYDKITLLQMKNDELSTMIANFASATYTTPSEPAVTTPTESIITPPVIIEPVVSGTTNTTNDEPTTPPTSSVVEPQPQVQQQTTAQEPSAEELKRREALELLLKKAQMLQDMYDEVLNETEN